MRDKRKGLQETEEWWMGILRNEVREKTLKDGDDVQNKLDTVFFFFNDTATTEIYTLSLHDALPIQDLVKIKQKRFEQAINLVEEKKVLLKREEDILTKVKKARDKVLKHKEDKLKQLRDALDEGERTDKIMQKKAYLDVVKDDLEGEEKKVKDQQKSVQEAEQELEKARENLKQKQKDIEKLRIHRKQWEKEMKYVERQQEQLVQDEIGSVKHIMKKKEQKKK